MNSFTKISVLIPTRNRTHLLRRLIDTYLSTTTADRMLTEMLFRADDDDAPTHEMLSREGFRVIVGPRMKGYASLPGFFNELARAADGDVVMLGNDDVEFVTHGWATAILAAANLYPDGVFNIGVKTHNEGHFPLSVVSRKAVDRLGHLFDPRIFWGDIYLRDVMGRFGRNVMLHDVEIQHQWMGFTPDKVFIEGEEARRSNWMTHHVQAVNEAEGNLRGLLS